MCVPHGAYVCVCVRKGCSEIEDDELGRSEEGKGESARKNESLFIK